MDAPAFGTSPYAALSARLERQTPDDAPRPGRAVKVGRRPPVGEALTARSLITSTMVDEGRQAFVGAFERRLGTRRDSHGERYTHLLGAEKVGAAGQ
jgi:hypothetical protein